MLEFGSHFFSIRRSGRRQSDQWLSSRDNEKGSTWATTVVQIWQRRRQLLSSKPQGFRTSYPLLMLVCFMPPPDRSHEVFTLASAQPIHNNALQHRSDRSLLSAALRLWYRMAAGSAWGDSVSRRFLDASASRYLLNRDRHSGIAWRLTLHQNTAIIGVSVLRDRPFPRLRPRTLNKSRALFPLPLTVDDRFWA